MRSSSLLTFFLLSSTPHPSTNTSFGSETAPQPLPTTAPSYRASIRRMKLALAEAPLIETKLDPIADFALKKCLNEGTLQKTRDYVYLKLDDSYLKQIFYKIKETHPEARMPSFRGKVGPHFSVIRHDEWKGTPPRTISEVGKKYLFTPVRVDIIETAHKRLWVLIVKPSSDLIAFREKHAIGGLPHGHEFHITLAQEPLK